VRAILGVGALVIILAGVRVTAPLLIPLVLALFLAVVTYPVVRVLLRWRVPLLAAVALTVVFTLAVLTGPAILIVTAVRQFGATVPQYEARLRVVVGDLFEWLRQHDIDTASLAGVFDPNQTFGLVLGALSSVATFISFGFMVVLIAAFMLVEAADAAGRPGTKLPADVQRKFARIAGDMQIWLWVKTAISLATGLSAGLWTALLGIEFALLWGLTAFLLNYIPNLGSILAAFPPALLALIEFGPGYALVVLAGYIAINIVFGNVLEPYLMGRRIGISPLVVLLSVIGWGWMWGVAGMLLSVPITMAIKLVLESVPEWRWAAALMAGDPTEVAAAPSPPAGRTDTGDPAGPLDR
jgi:predicted PurR-regulated permease PerM